MLRERRPGKIYYSDGCFSPVGKYTVVCLKTQKEKCKFDILEQGKEYPVSIIQHNMTLQDALCWAYIESSDCERIIVETPEGFALDI